MRYFLIFYNHSTGSSFGNGIYAWKSKTYPNLDEIAKSIKEYGSEKVIATNILELSKEDFESATK